MATALNELAAAEAARNTKYRPLLSEQHLLTIVMELRKLPMTYDIGDCLRVLEPFLFKVRNRFNAPAYKAVPKESLEKLLGVDTRPTTLQKQIAKLSLEGAYKKWALDATSCSAEEVADADCYRYEQALMTEAEMDEYIKRLESQSGI